MGARLQASKGTWEALGTVKAAMEAGKLPAPVVSSELGITGTTNWFGDILSESNTKLLHQLAYGQAGTRTWGEWEKILRTDEAVAKAVEFTKAQLRDARVDVEEASEMVMKDRALAKAQADFVRWNLTEALEPGWAELIQQQTEGLLIPGFVLHEEVIDTCAHPLLPMGSGYKLAKLAERLPISIHVNGWLEENGELAGVKQLGQLRDGKTFGQVVLPASKLLLASWNRKGNNYLGFSPFRAVWYMCKIREQLLKLLGISMVRENAGVPVAEPEKGVKLSKMQQKKLQRFLANIVPHENASIVMPAGVKMQWVFSPGANKSHILEAWRELGTSVLGQVQAQQMALGTSNTGSRAVGTVHDQVANAFAQGVVATLEAAWNGTGANSRPYEGPLRKLVRLNWGEQPAYPKLKLTLRQSKLAPADYAAAAKTLRDGGIITVHTLDDENAARERIGDRPITEEEFEAAKQEKADAAAQMAQQLQKSETPAPKPGQPTETKPPKPGDKTETPAPKGARRRASDAYVPRRPLRASEQKLNLPAMADFFDSQRDAFERGARPLVTEMLTRTVPDVRAAMKDGRIDHDEIATLPLNMSRLDKFIGQFIARARAEGWKHLAAELKRGVKPRTAAAEEEDDQLTFPPPETTPPSPDKQTSELLDAQRKQLLRRMEARLRAELEETAIDVARTGGSADEVVADVVSNQVQTSALKGDAGSVLTKAFNLGRAEFAEQYGDQIDSVELSSILDDGTCGPCESMDGTEFDFGSSEYERNTPPLRICDGRNRCRCLYVYNFKEDGFQPVDDSSDE